MNIRIKNKISYLLFAVLVTCFMFSNVNIAKAASATISFDTKDSVAQIGDTISVTMIVSSDAFIGDFEAFVSYDSNILEFKSGSTNVSGGAGLLRISDMGSDQPNEKKKYAMEFKALATGACEIAISDKPMVYDYDESVEMSVSSTRLSITVDSSKDLSKDNSLSSLKVNPGTLSPEFQIGNNEYTVSVSNETTRLLVSAVAKDPNATVTVKGADDLKEGDNTVTITVKAESGDTKDYVIIAKREAATLEGEQEGDSDSDQVELEQFKVIKEEDSLFIQNSYRYEILEADPALLPTGYVKTKLILYGITVPAYTLEKDLENDFILLYAKSSEGEEGFYQYDRVEKTIQRYQGQVKVATDNTVLTADAYNKKLNQLAIVIAVLSAVTVLSLVAVVSILIKMKGYKEDLD